MRPASIFGVAFAALFSLSGLWAVASPIFSSPDENAHALKAVALVRGDLMGHSEPDARFPVVELPDGYEYPSNIVCFAYNSETPASCSARLGDEGASDSFSTWVARYNPVYYALVGWPSLILSGDAGVIGMRLAGSLVCSALLAGAVAIAASRRRGAWAVSGAVFLASPMVVYLASSVSPQGMEIAAAALLWSALPRLLEEGVSGPPTRWLWVAVVTAAAALAVARAIGPLWVVLIVAFCLAVAGRSAIVALFTRRESYFWMGLVAAANVFSLLWTLGGGSLAGQAEEGDALLVGGSFWEGAWAMLRATPSLVLQSAGVFGWLDTDLPTIAYAGYAALIALPVVLAILGTDRRGRVVVGAAIIAGIAIPVVVQSASVAQTGIVWQGRYGMFWYVGVPLLAAATLSSPAGEWLRRLAFPISSLIGVGVAVYGFGAFLVVLRRYVIGTAAPIGDMLTAPQWQPPGGWMLLVVAMAVVSTASAVGAVALAKICAREVVDS